MKKLVLLHDVSPGDNIDDLVEMVMAAIHGDGPWPEDDGVDLGENNAESGPGSAPTTRTWSS
jgi:hypothetical protein